MSTYKCVAHNVPCAARLYPVRARGAWTESQWKARRRASRLHVISVVTVCPLDGSTRSIVLTVSTG